MAALDGLCPTAIGECALDRLHLQTHLPRDGSRPLTLFDHPGARLATFAGVRRPSEAIMPLQLAVTEYGAGPPVAILHGLFGAGRNWSTITQHLAARHRVLALDLRNHGGSPWADTMTYPEMAEDVRATLHAWGCRRAALIGHSMGGKAAMMLALLHADEVGRLVVVDIAPVAYPPHHLALTRAMRALDLAGVTRRGEAGDRLAGAVPDAGERNFLLQNLVFENGSVRWRINLAVLEREMSHLAGFPAISAGTVFDGPALFIAGTRSDYVRAEYAPAIRRLFSRADIVRIDGAGHWLHAEQPSAFLAYVEPFLAGAD
jgi:esterase